MGARWRVQREGPPTDPQRTASPGLHPRQKCCARRRYGYAMGRRASSAVQGPPCSQLAAAAAAAAAPRPLRVPSPPAWRLTSTVTTTCMVCCHCATDRDRRRREEGGGRRCGGSSHVGMWEVLHFHMARMTCPLGREGAWTPITTRRDVIGQAMSSVARSTPHAIYLSSRVWVVNSVVASVPSSSLCFG